MKNLILITFIVVGFFAKAQQSELIEGSKAYYNNAPLSISEVNLVTNHFQIAFHHEYLVVKSSQSVAESVLIFDLNGRLILRSKIINEKVFVGQVPNSIYIVQIEDINGNFYNKKVIKNTKN